MVEYSLKLEDINKSFKIAKQELKILKGVNFSLKKGELVCLFAPSGSGKTTLLQIMGLLSTPDSGQILIEGRDVSHLKEKVLDRVRAKRFGFIFQHHYLLPEFTALKNVALPARIIGESKAKAEKKARVLLAEMGMSERENHFPSELSGGERQRIAIARALCNDPEIILADEPTGNLDPANSDKVFSLLLETLRQKNHSTLLVTHNTDLAKQMDSCVTIVDGKVEALKL